MDEAFNVRSIPLSILFALGAHKAIKRGYWRPTRLFGSLPAVIGSSVLGCFIGLYSYKNKCVEKFRLANDSSFGEMLRMSNYFKDKGLASQIAEQKPIAKFKKVKMAFER